ncbi:hypothetical protein BPAE_0118g00160 [Botrytis paeoniae]|uniref:Uncharacterized protein n=1 Tax=Botrytis paeoniae TaxID=278948 RepID=A0A4Z1FLM1_9HELO|nr:hypothetical protein BPAE_0118g00160 [Botrytis paeoniae]
MTKLLNNIYSRCPCLKTLSVISSENCPREMPTATRLLSINKDLLKLDLRNKDELQLPLEEADHRYGVLENTLKARYLFNRHFESYRKEVEEEGNKDAIEYWKKVEVVNVLHCWPDEPQDESNLYILEIDSYVRHLLSLVELGDEQWSHELQQ